MAKTPAFNNDESVSDGLPGESDGKLDLVMNLNLFEDCKPFKKCTF